MALTAQFVINAPCDGDDHFTASLDFTPGPTVTIGVSKATITSAITTEDREQLGHLLLKAARAQNPGASASQLRTAVNAKVWDFTVVA